MQQDILISIGTKEALTIIFSAVGLLVTGTWYLSHRLTKVEVKVEAFETQLYNLAGRLDSAFGSGSPLKLYPKGEAILEESGLKDYIDSNKDNLISKCKGENSMLNPYDIQESAFKFFDKMELPELEDKMKTAAFNNGVGIETVRRVGGIYFRDICLLVHNFKPEDLDSPKE